MATEVHVGDIGTAFRATIRDENGDTIDVSVAESLSLRFQKPDKTVLEFTPQLVGGGTNGIIEYVTVAGDLDMPGSWRLQAIVGMAGDLWHSDIRNIKVYKNLE